MEPGLKVGVSVGVGGVVGVYVGVGVSVAVGVLVTVGVAVGVEVGRGVDVGRRTLKCTRASALPPDLLKTVMRTVTGPVWKDDRSKLASGPVLCTGFVVGPTIPPHPCGSALRP